MRPWTALSFDGNANTYEAIALAADPESRNRGAMVAFGDRIVRYYSHPTYKLNVHVHLCSQVPGYWVTKTNANTPETFMALDQGYLGQFLNMKPYFYNTPSQPRDKPVFDQYLEEIDVLPKVDSRS